jgi:hypothetical protein
MPRSAGLTASDATVEYYLRFFPERWPAKITPQSNHFIAIVAELADAHGSGPCTRKGVGVRVPSMAPFFSFPLVRLRLGHGISPARHLSAG